MSLIAAASGKAADEDEAGAGAAGVTAAGTPMPTPTTQRTNQKPQTTSPSTPTKKWQMIKPNPRRPSKSASQSPLAQNPNPRPSKARLLQCDSTRINAQRLESAQALAEAYNSIIVLKGAGTLVCAPRSSDNHKAECGEWGICAAGNAGLARGGSGDVLAGIIGAVLLQIPNPFDAVCTAVWLHAAAADRLNQQHGMLAVDINQLATAAARLAHTTQE